MSGGRNMLDAWHHEFVEGLTGMDWIDKRIDEPKQSLWPIIIGMLLGTAIGTTLGTLAGLGLL